MAHQFKFFKGRANVEVFRINVRDPVNGDGAIDPSTLSKIELVFSGGVDVVISSETNEITWEGDVIQIKPSEAHLQQLPKQCFSELVAYKDTEDISISYGDVLVSDFG